MKQIVWGTHCLVCDWPSLGKEGEMWWKATCDPAIPETGKVAEHPSARGIHPLSS